MTFVNDVMPSIVTLAASPFVNDGGNDMIATTSRRNIDSSRSNASPPGSTEPHRSSEHPHSVAVLAPDEAPAHPFAEGVQDELNRDLRHRLISEVAYQRYVERGYADGDDLDDWLQAESEVDHMRVDPQAT